MNRVAKYVVAFLLMYSGHIVSLEQEWKPTDFKNFNPWDVTAFKTKAEERQKVAEEEKKNAKDPEKIKEAELKIKQAAYDVASAQSIELERKSYPLREEEQLKKESEKAKKALAGEIQQLLMQLQPKDIGEVLTTLASQNPKLGQFDRAFENKLDNINKESMREKKQASIHDFRNQIETVRKNIQEELKKLEEKKEGALTKEEKDRRADLRSVLANIDTKLVKLLGADAQIIVQQAHESTFQKLLRTIKEFFNGILLQLGLSKNENDINTQITNFTNVTNRYQLKPLQDFVSKKNEIMKSLTENISKLKADATAVKTKQEIQELQERAAVLQSAITDLEKMQSDLSEASKSVYDISQAFSSIRFRIRGHEGLENWTLYDVLYRYYNQGSFLLSRSENPWGFYALIGMPENSSAEAIAKKREQLRKAGASIDVQDIARYLSNPVSKGTYDAFLADGRALRDRNLTDQARIDFLNNEGALSKIELKGVMLKQVNDIVSTLKSINLLESSIDIDSGKNTLQRIIKDLNYKSLVTPNVPPPGG